MTNSQQKPVDKSTVKALIDYKNWQMKHWLILAGGIITLAMLVVVFITRNKPPSTYDEIYPMMQEAREFENKASEIAGVYEPIEDQVGEDLYFETIEQDYQSAIDYQAELQAKIEQADREIEAMGGITNYKDLQSVKQVATNPAWASAYEEQAEGKLGASFRQ